MDIYSRNLSPVSKTPGIQTTPAVPPCKYTGTAHNDRGMLELNAYNRCVSFGDKPMYTLPTSTQSPQQNIIHTFDHFYEVLVHFSFHSISVKKTV